MAVEIVSPLEAKIVEGKDTDDQTMKLVIDFIANGPPAKGHFKRRGAGKIWRVVNLLSKLPGNRYAG